MHHGGMLGFIVAGSVHATLCGMSAALNSMKLGTSMDKTLTRRRYLERLLKCIS